MILHGLDAKERGATKLFIFAQDTDVLVLMARRYPKLPKESFFVAVPGEYISIGQIYASLGQLKAAALPGFHALSGCDTTGCLKGKGKLSYWKAFSLSNDEILSSFASLGKNDIVTDETLYNLEEFLCRVYQPESKSQIKTLAALRWSLFSTKQTVGDSLPPTTGAFIPAVKRANFQAIVWAQDDIAIPAIPSPTKHGWVLPWKMDGCHRL